MFGLLGKNMIFVCTLLLILQLLLLYNITKTESIQVSLPDMSAESPIMKNQLKRSYQ